MCDAFALLSVARALSQPVWILYTMHILIITTMHAYSEQKKNSLLNAFLSFMMM